ncbi:GNAT family N-acetyltransferase [Rhodococcus sp. NPDC003318]|uniref:GNAT family N-acetyltransferase n=1 Tax=Rhodococcus sp. NPDC003318 TaxID=3364503 RepID=UPI0036C1B85B
MFVVNLSGRRLTLTPPTVADVDTIARLCRDESVGRWTTMPVPYERADAVAFVTRMVPTGWADRSPTWALRLDPDGPVAGMIGLRALDESAAEIGFWQGAAARGRGLMTEAAQLVCDFAFRADTLALERIEWRAFVGNTASAAVARRVGFRFEGVARRGGLQRGLRRDMWVAGLLAGDSRSPVPGGWESVLPY